MNIFYEYMYDSNGRLLTAIQENSHSIPHFHSCFEVLYVVEGDVVATVNGKSAKLQEGDLYVAGSYDIHKTYTEKQSKCIVMIIPNTFLNGFTQIAKGRVFKNHFLTSCEQSKEIRRCLELLIKNNTDPVSLSLRCRGYLYVIFGILMQSLTLEDEPQQKDCQLPQQILLYIQEHIEGKLTLSEVAARFGYNDRYFSGFFRKHFGCGFNEYVNMLRVQHAASLFENGGTFLAAALESGFESQRTFNRVFKKIYGKTPTEYNISLGCKNK